jgi:hypothetical protein
MVAITRMIPILKNGRITPNAMPNDESAFITIKATLHSAAYLSIQLEKQKTLMKHNKSKPGKKTKGNNAKPKNFLLYF